MTDFNVAITGGETDIRRSTGDIPGRNYEEYRLSASVQLNPVYEKWGVALLPVVEGGYGYTVGDAASGGSSRRQGFATGGVRLKSPHLTLGPVSVAAFVGGLGGVALNKTRFAFGAGIIPLPQDTNVSAIGSGQAGLEVCLGRHPCVAAFWSPLYEREISGGPHYINRSLTFFGAAVRFPTGPDVVVVPSPPECTTEEIEREAEEWKQQSDAATAELKVRTAERDELIAEKQRILGHVALLEKQGTMAAMLQKDPVDVTLVLFPNGSAELPVTPDSRHGFQPTPHNPLLDILAEHIRQHPGVHIRIHGSANEAHDAFANQRLADGRANTVRDYLLGKGVNPAQIEVAPTGEAKLLAPADPDGPINRSVHFTEVKKP